MLVATSRMASIHMSHHIKWNRLWCRLIILTLTVEMMWRWWNWPALLPGQIMSVLYAYPPLTPCSQVAWCALSLAGGTSGIMVRLSKFMTLFIACIHMTFGQHFYHQIPIILEMYNIHLLIFVIEALYLYWTQTLATLFVLHPLSSYSPQSLCQDSGLCRKCRCQSSPRVHVRRCTKRTRRSRWTSCMTWSVLDTRRAARTPARYCWISCLCCVYINKTRSGIENILDYLLLFLLVT